MSLNDEAVTAAATVHLGAAWASLDDYFRASLRPQIINEVTAAFRVDRDAISAAGQSGSPYVPSDAAVMAAIETAAAVHNGWAGYDGGLRDVLMADYRNEIAAAAAVQYNLNEGIR